MIEAKMHDSFVCRHCGAEIKMAEPMMMLPTICDPCWEKKKREEDAAILRARAFRIRKAAEDICPPQYKETDPDRLPCQAAWDRVKAWEPKPPPLSGLLFVGKTGLGKTRMAWLVALRLADRGRRLVAWNAPKLADKLSLLSSESMRAYNNLVDECSQTNVLLLDDLGKDCPTRRWEEAIYRIVEHRTSHGLPIISTTNFTGQQLIDRSQDGSGATVRRIRESSEVIVCERDEK